MPEPRILLYDIEHGPTRGWVWRRYETDLIDVDADWYLLCFAYKWLDEKEIHTVALPDFKLYDRDPENDIGVATELWHLFDQADIVIAHNGNKFDQGKARARFLVHGFDPPSPFREIDTLVVARRKFNFLDNRLDGLCRQLGIGRKVAHHGAKTWFGCMEGDPKAWATMLRYNKRDVEMLEGLYLRLRPWMDQHPNLALIAGRPGDCPKCGKPGPWQKRGTRKFSATVRQTWQCQSCGGYSSDRLSDPRHPKPLRNAA